MKILPPSDEPAFWEANASGLPVIVFFDFDDVLAIHPEHTSAEVVKALRSGNPDQAGELWANVFHEQLRENLKALADEFAPQFVISSSWATYLSHREISDVLIRAGLDFVASSLHTDWRTAIDLGSFRVNEIDSWLQRNGGHSAHAFVILYDVSSGRTLYRSPLEAYTVFCEEWVGFVNLRLAEPQAILREQLSGGARVGRRV